MMDSKQYIFAICDLLGISAQGGGFSVAHEASSDLQATSEPWIYQWDLDLPKPSHEDIAAHWEQAKDRYVDPFEPHASIYPQFTALQMLDLFTEAEQLAVVEAAMSSPAVKLWYDRMIAATFVTYEDPRTEGGLQALVDAGLLTPDRKAVIVAAMQPPLAA